MSRQCRVQGSACVHGDSDLAHVTRCSVRDQAALSARQTCHSALCCALFVMLFMSTAHEHCSRPLSKKKKKKKKDPRELGCHIPHVTSFRLVAPKPVGLRVLGVEHL